MSEIFYSHENRTWIKECTGPCDLSFAVQASNISEAEELMMEHFYSGKDPNGFSSECKSCANDRRRGRQSTKHRDEMLEEQHGKCELCFVDISFKNRSAVIDHCHLSGFSRKVLCTGCNTWMAAVDDDEWLTRAIIYRDSYRKEST